jgi:hypothetical protein
VLPVLESLEREGILRGYSIECSAIRQKGSTLHQVLGLRRRLAGHFLELRKL